MQNLLYCHHLLLMPVLCISIALKVYLVDYNDHTCPDWWLILLIIRYLYSLGTTTSWLRHVHRLCFVIDRVLANRRYTFFAMFCVNHPFILYPDFFFRLRFQ